MLFICNFFMTFNGYFKGKGDIHKTSLSREVA